MKDPQFDSYANDYKDVVKQSAGIIPVQKDFYLLAKLDMLSDMIAQLPQNAKILDFGCGIGGLVIPLSKMYPDLNFYAFDVSPESVAKISDQKISNIFCMSEESELTKEEFTSSLDLVFCINVLHHIDKNQRNSKVQIIKNMLKPGGKLLILEHNPINPLTRMVVSRCEFDEGVELLGKGELKSLMIKNSMELAGHWYILFFPVYNKFFAGLEKLISFLPFGAQHCILGIKKE